MSAAKYVGRIGALAVALGIGSAVVTVPWVALAEPTAQSESTDVQSTPADEPAPGPSASGPADEGSAAQPEKADEPDESDEPAEEAAPTLTEADAEAEPEAEPEPEPDDVVVDGDDDSGPGRDVTREVVRIAGSAADADADDEVEAAEVVETADEDAVEPPTGPPAAPDADPEPAAPQTDSQAVRLAEPLAPAASASLASEPVARVAAWVGAGPTADSSPASPADIPMLWGLLEWFRRQVHHTFFNRTPTSAYDPAENSLGEDGVITGNLRASDPDGDPLTFTVIQEPEHGTLVVDRNGRFTYTPDAEFARVGTDTFTIQIDDGAAYRQAGPAGLILNSLHRLAQAVGFAGSDTINSHPTVNVTPEVVIDVGSQPAAVAVSADGATAYVVNQIDETVSVVDTATNTVTDTIAVGANPVAVAVSPNGSRVYVSNLSGGTVSVIDTATNAVIGTITVGSHPSGLALSPLGGILYVANTEDHTVMKINTSSQTVLATIDVTGYPHDVAVSPDGTRVYVTCEGVGGQQGVGTLAVIETTNNTVISTIPVGGFFPRGVAVSPNGTRVYVANQSDNTVRVIDTASLSVTATVNVGAGPIGVAVSPDGKRVYATNFDDGTVSVIGTVSNTVTGTRTVGTHPRGVAVSSDNRIYVTNAGDGTLYVRG